MPKAPTPQVLEDVFAWLAEYAARGERCPQVGTSRPGTKFPLTSAHTSALAHAGKIRVEIFRYNWRVITILVGEHKGKSTERDPNDGFPYLTVDARGTFRNGRQIATRLRDRGPEPSAPRKIGAGP